MAYSYNEKLAERVIHLLKQKGVDYEEKRMFGGLCFMVCNKMAISVCKGKDGISDQLTFRCERVMQETYLKMPNVLPVDSTGMPLSGFLFVESSGIQDDESLKKWVYIGVNYAKSQSIEASNKNKSAYRKRITAKRKLEREAAVTETPTKEQGDESSKSEPVDTSNKKSKKDDEKEVVESSSPVATKKGKDVGQRPNRK